MGSYIGSKHNHSELSLTNKLKWQLIISASTSIQGIIQQLEQPQYSAMLKILNLIPSNYLVRFIERSTMRIFNRNPTRNYDHRKKFKNWGQTIEAIYSQILYPTEIPAKSGKQIEAIQNFIIDGVRSGKRIRGSGIRHSWGNIFADNQQLLVSFYPYNVVTGNSRQLREYAAQMNKLQQSLTLDGIEHLCMIRDMKKSFRVIEDRKEVVKHLVKVGAGVSNEQIRMWCINKGFQYKSNVIMIEVNFCGGLGTCSHGAGLSTQTLADYIYEIEFIDYNGNRQTISKKESPHLIKSAASAMGLLGLVVFITLQMEKLQIVRVLPRTSYKDFIIPWPKDYPKEKQEARLQKQEWKAWRAIQQRKADDEDWQSSFQKFKKAVNESYCEWFYFPIEELRIFENVWSIYGQKTPQNLAKIAEENPKGKFIDQYPAPAIQFFCEFGFFIGGQLINHELTQSAINLFARAPFAFFPHSNTYINYPDAVHYQRGIHNVKTRSLECLINVPALEGSNGKEPDYHLIQQIWWTTLEIVEDSKKLASMTLEMRILKGSEATLAPEFGMEFVCSIEIVRTKTLNSKTENKWRIFVQNTFDAWCSITDANGRKLIVRPHWGKQWDFYPLIKTHVMQDQGMKHQLQTFLNHYREIAQLRNFDCKKNLSTFSNQIYRELLNNTIQNQTDKIQ